MPSSFPLLRARASEKTCRLAIVLFNGSALSASTVSTRRNALRAAWVMPSPAPGSATSVVTAPEFASNVPPSSAITGTPVKPWNSSPTLVSERTGVVEATEIVASTRRGLSGARPRSVTSPTRIPLNSTAAPTSSPGTEPSNWM